MTRWSRLLPIPVVVAGALALPASPAQGYERYGAGDHHCTPDRPGALGERWPLYPGDEGQDIRVLQDFLNQVGGDLRIDGQFGPGTESAVDAWKGGEGREQDGRMTCGDIRVLRDAMSGGPADDENDEKSRHCTPRTPGALGERWPLERGDEGQDIRVLQDFLNQLGDELRIDGVYGSVTEQAVDGWKSAAGREQDGRMTCSDIRVLREAIAGVPEEGARDEGPQPGDLPEGARARVTEDGFAVAPAGAPQVVKDMIAAGNEIARTPYKYGGGHGGRWEDSGYDCSGSVSYVLHGAGIVDRSMPSGGYMAWGEAGEGDWVTVYAHEGHMYMVVAGLRFDTSGREEAGTRWHEEMRDPDAFQVRHPAGL